MWGKNQYFWSYFMGFSPRDYVICSQLIQSCFSSYSLAELLPQSVFSDKNAIYSYLNAVFYFNVSLDDGCFFRHWLHFGFFFGTVFSFLCILLFLVFLFYYLKDLLDCIIYSCFIIIYFY